MAPKEEVAEAEEKVQTAVEEHTDAEGAAEVAEKVAKEIAEGEEEANLGGQERGREEAEVPKEEATPEPGGGAGRKRCHQAPQQATRRCTTAILYSPYSHNFTLGQAERMCRQEEDTEQDIEVAKDAEVAKEDVEAAVEEHTDTEVAKNTEVTEEGAEEVAVVEEDVKAAVEEYTKSKEAEVAEKIAKGDAEDEEVVEAVVEEHADTKGAEVTEEGAEEVAEASRGEGNGLQWWEEWTRNCFRWWTEGTRNCRPGDIAIPTLQQQRQQAQPTRQDFTDRTPTQHLLNRPDSHRLDPGRARRRCHREEEATPEGQEGGREEAEAPEEEAKDKEAPKEPSKVTSSSEAEGTDGIMRPRNEEELPGGVSQSGLHRLYPRGCNPTATPGVMPRGGAARGRCRQEEGLPGGEAASRRLLAGGCHQTSDTRRSCQEGSHRPDSHSKDHRPYSKNRNPQATVPQPILGPCQLLDTPEGQAIVIGSQYDWSQAFDRQDPTKAVQQFIKMGVTPSLIPVLIDF